MEYEQNAKIGIKGSNKCYERIPKQYGYRSHNLTVEQLQAQWKIHDDAIQSKTNSAKQDKMDWHFRAQCEQLIKDKQNEKD